jgi:HEPN domain-containing protein
MNRWRDWYDQGRRDRERAVLDIRFGYFEWACFTSQHSAEKVVKALGMAKGVALWGHSLTEMLHLLEEHLEVPEGVKEAGRRLDLYYIPPRYPNRFAAGKPAD